MIIYSVLLSLFLALVVYFYNWLHTITTIGPHPGLLYKYCGQRSRRLIIEERHGSSQYRTNLQKERLKRLGKLVEVCRALLLCWFFKNIYIAAFSAGKLYNSGGVRRGDSIYLNKKTQKKYICT